VLKKKCKFFGLTKISKIKQEFFFTCEEKRRKKKFQRTKKLTITGKSGGVQTIEVGDTRLADGGGKAGLAVVPC
jgi:hypothetical protein